MIPPPVAVASSCRQVLLLPRRRPLSLTASCGRFLHWRCSSPALAPSTRWVAVQSSSISRHCSSHNPRYQSSVAASTPTEEDEDSLIEHFSVKRRKGIRNVAVVAHVDHGKTTLVDQLIRLSSNNSSSQLHPASMSEQQQQVGTAAVDRLMDSSELEKERGITITSKVTRLVYRFDEYQNNPLVVNCVDTPGHSDFSAEVDRILSMVDGVVLVVDAAEGPKSQTKYVLSRALWLGLQPLVVLNKCDRPDAVNLIDTGETEEKIRALFQALLSSNHNASASSLLSYRTLYASAKDGWITEDPTEVLDLVDHGYKGQPQFSMKQLVEAIVHDIPEPSIRSYNCATNNKMLAGKSSGLAEDEATDEESLSNDPFSLAAVSVGYDPYLGRTCTGRIFSGSIRVNDPVLLLKRDTKSVGGAAAAAAEDNIKQQRGGVDLTGTVSGIFVYEGISRTPLKETAYAGEIVSLSGVPDAISVGDTLTGKSNPVPVPIETPPLAPPTLSMEFGANSGPLAGQEGSKIASSQIRDRLMAEADNNVTLIVQKSETDPDKTAVFARGELQLGILVETMRREGFEMVISPPRILTKECTETRKTLEPFEEVTVDVDTEHASAVVSSLAGDRKGILLESTMSSDGKTHLVFEVPSRGLLGFQSEIATATKGSAVVNHIYLGHREYVGSLGAGLEKGKLVSTAAGKATAYALASLEQRGVLFIEPSDPVYPGMVIGQNAKQGDLEVNPIRAKDKTNVRTVAKDEKVLLAPPTKYSVEELIGYMQSDELIEVTPKSVRLRKELLDSSSRERAAKTKAKQLRSLKERNAN